MASFLLVFLFPIFTRERKKSPNTRNGIFLRLKKKLSFFKDLASCGNKSRCLSVAEDSVAEDSVAEDSEEHEPKGNIIIDFYNLVQQAINEGDSIEDFYKKWVENMDKVRYSFINDPQYDEMISEFIKKNTEFIKSTMELYQNSVMTLCDAEKYNNGSDKNDPE